MTQTRPPAAIDQLCSLRILHAAAECTPFATTGGLGDVLAALPGAQRAIGIDARIILPRYGFLAEAAVQGEIVAEMDVLGCRASIIESTSSANGAPIYWCDIAELFGHSADPYRHADGTELEDLALRFAAFSEAVARFASMDDGFAPQLVHAHDWHTALLPAWLQELRSPARSVLSIHNLAFQGRFDDELLRRCRPPASVAAELRADGGGSFLRAGIRRADATTTVSASYAREIQQPAQGFGLDRLLAAQAAAGQLHGIVNGIDERSWDPRTDPALARNYGIDDVDAGKRHNRAVLAEELGLDGGDSPIVAFVGRLTDQKGVDLIAAAATALLALNARYIVIGVGDAGLTRQLEDLQARAPGRLAFCNRYDPPLVRRVLAGADLLLMPSRFEPCGMLQMYAQRYGTIPVVRATGGLIDTVVDATAATLADGSATGVKFSDADVGGLCYGVSSGLRLLAEAPALQALRRRGMSRSFDWAATAAEYRRLYLDCLGTTRAAQQPAYAAA